MLGHIWKEQSVNPMTCTSTMSWNRSTPILVSPPRSWTLFQKMISSADSQQGIDLHKRLVRSKIWGSHVLKFLNISFDFNYWAISTVKGSYLLAQFLGPGNTVLHEICWSGSVAIYWIWTNSLNFTSISKNICVSRNRLRVSLLHRVEKKNSWPVSGLGNRVHLKDLNDSK